MAPIRIQHIVSFSSQDPRYPVDGLLNEDAMRPWLSCPGERSRQQKVELQLERACHIGYIDIGNSGSAFLQIDVGRSSWPLDRPYVTLLPTTTLMTPGDSKLGRNGNGVRMLKKGDFIEAAAAEKWDRLRVTCSQPFNKRLQYGLSFIRLRSLPGEDHQEDVAPLATSLISRDEPTGEDAESRYHLEEKIKEKLQKVASPSPPRTSTMTRTARMLLNAATSRKRRHPITAPQSPPIPLHPGDCESPVSSGSCAETSTTRHSPVHEEAEKRSRRRRLMMAGVRARAQTRVAERRERDSPGTAQRSPETAGKCSSCPICGGYFPAALLPVHASTCGEDPPAPSIALSSDDDSWDDESRVQCPLCGFPFRSSEIEEHAGTCGE